MRKLLPRVRRAEGEESIAGYDDEEKQLG